MSLPTAIRSTLLANSTLNGQTGERVYYMRFPQDDKQPAVAYKPLGNVNLHTHAGTSVLLQPEVRLILRAQSLSAIETMRQSIVDQWNAPEIAVAGYAAVQCQVNDLGAEYDGTLDVYFHFINLNLQMRNA